MLCNREVKIFISKNPNGFLYSIHSKKRLPLYLLAVGAIFLIPASPIRESRA